MRFDLCIFVPWCYWWSQLTYTLKCSDLYIGLTMMDFMVLQIYLDVTLLHKGALQKCLVALHPTFTHDAYFRCFRNGHVPSKRHLGSP